jgi:hypothetical protein
MQGMGLATREPEALRAPTEEPPWSEPGDPSINKIEILKAVGELAFPANVCHPELSIPLQMVRASMAAPNDKTYRWLNHAKKYLVGGMSQAEPKVRGLFFKYSADPDNGEWCGGVTWKFTLFTDASYYNNPSRSKSTFGGFILMDNLSNNLAHGSRTLPNSPSSTHDAEVQMLAKAVMHSLGVCSLPEDLGLKTEKLKALCDNSAAVVVGQTGVHKEASRLAWIRYWQLRDLIELSVIDLQHVSSAENIANIMTKVLRGQDFVQQRDRIVAVRPRIFKTKKQ